MEAEVLDRPVVKFTDNYIEPSEDTQTAEEAEKKIPAEKTVEGEPNTEKSGEEKKEEGGEVEGAKKDEGTEGAAKETVQQAAPITTQTAPVETKPAPVDPFVERLLPLKEDKAFNELLKAYEAGDVDNYLKVKSTDWDKVPDIDVVRQKIEDKYKSLDPKKRDFIVAREMAKYNTDSFDEDEKMAAEIQLELEAREIRDGFKAKQAQYQIPDRTPKVDPEETARIAQQQQEAAAFEASLKADPALKSFETNKTVQIGNGTDAFNYAVELTQEQILGGDPSLFFDKQPDGSEKFNMAKRIEVMAFAKDPKRYLTEFAKHVKAQARKEFDKELRNPGSSTATAAPADNSSSVKWKGDV